MKYRKKPVVIEAIQFTGTAESIKEIMQFVTFPLDKAVVLTKKYLIIPTLEGDHIANPGDFIIKGVKGEFYPCKPDIFEMTYEPV